MIFYCQFCKSFSSTTRSGIHYHENRCIANPNRKITKGHPVSEETKKKISSGMKKAHKEGKHNGWANTRKNQYGMSYPEKWFSEVIKNNFVDKDYEYNLPVGHYKLDFAWPKKMLYIEIDGSQHKLFRERDQKRDEFLRSLGWKCLRLDWEFIVNNKQDAIQIANDFILSGKERNITWKKKSEIISEKRKLFIDKGLITKNGKINTNGISKEEYELRKQRIINSGVDLTKFGWVGKVEKITGLSKHQIEKVVQHFNLNVFTRKRSK
jgi:very-short-patch-repair endonuclease